MKLNNLILKGGNYLNTIKTKTNLNNDQLKYILIGVIILIILVAIILFIKNARFKKENPTFFTKPKNATKYVSIPSKLFYQPISGYNFSMTFWVRVTNWGYKLNSEKHILTKGNNENNIRSNSSVCPSIWWDDSINDLNFYVATLKGLQKFKLRDIPIGNWNHIAIVFRSKTVALYFHPIEINILDIAYMQ